MINTVLLTGASGLLGKEVIQALVKENLTVFSLTKNSQNIPGCHNITVDFSINWSSQNLPNKIDAVIHLAQSNYYKDFPNSATDIFGVNVASTSSLLDYARMAKAKIFIYASTGGLYGGSEFYHKEIQRPLFNVDNNFYFSSKSCSEILIHNYKHMFKTIIFRPFFIYGSNQARHMLIPRLFDKVASGNSIPICGNNGIKINPIHVNDAANALILALNSNESRIYNLGGPEALSIREISELFGKHLRTKPKFQHSNDYSQNLLGDISLLSNELYRPQIKLSEKVFELEINSPYKSKKIS